MPPEHLPGFRFKQGRLCITTAERIITIEGWPDLKAVRREAYESERLAQEYVPKFRLLRPPRASVTPAPLGPQVDGLRGIDPDLQRATAFNAFRYTMPPEIAAASERFPGRQWRLLQLCTLREEAVELLAQNPALGFCLAHQRLLQAPAPDGRRKVHEMVVAKRRDILEWVRFPASEAVVKILAKIRPELVEIERMMLLREALKQEETLPLLAHVPAINAGVLALATSPTAVDLVSAKLLNEVATLEPEAGQLDTAELIHQTRAMLRKVDPGARLPRFETTAQVRAAHEEVSCRYRRLEWAQEVDRLVRFPPPPLRGTDAIIPLWSARDMLDEAEEQQNCVLSYAPEVIAGKCYIYRVLKPQRATLSIARGPDGWWQIKELKLKANRNTSGETLQSVHDWLRRHCFSV